MLLLRFRVGERVSYGVLKGETVTTVVAAPLSTWPEGLQRTSEQLPLSSVELLAPLRPGKIICVGLNYRKHAMEFGQPLPEDPLLFMKPPSAVIGPNAPIVLPSMSNRVDYEGELVAVIGKQLKDASPAEAKAGILGFTCGNDVTARDLQKKDGQWTRAKSFDTFAPLGPYIAVGADTADLEISTYVNGCRVQRDMTSDMIFPVSELIAFMSRVMTLESGDVVFTGTPSGVGPLSPGDLVEVEVGNAGRLANPVRRA